MKQNESEIILQNIRNQLGTDVIFETGCDIYLYKKHTIALTDHVSFWK